MITIFTTAKPFVGKTKINQVNALRSWKVLSPDVEVILFGSGEGYAEVARELDLMHISEVETSEQGTPLLNSLFALAQAHGHYRVQVYVNCDIILLDDFLPAIQRINMDRFLMVGQRWDLDLNREIDFEDDAWQRNLRNEVNRRAQLMDPSGIDYFVYKSGDMWKDIPPMVIGRTSYDNWLIYHCRLHRIPVIDATQVVTVVHQNHDYNWLYITCEKDILTSSEAQLNRDLVGHRRHLFTIVDADWRLTPKKLSRNYCQGDWTRLVEVYLILRCDSELVRWAWRNVPRIRRIPSRMRTELKRIGDLGGWAR